MPLTIGKDGFSLPLELVTSTQAILARKRSGKSYTASIQAEELLAHKQQIAAIDPTGAWWVCGHQPRGEGAGYPVVVFGGDHAAVPLEADAGRVLARALVGQGFSAIFDVGLMLTDDQIRFTSTSRANCCASIARLSTSITQKLLPLMNDGGRIVMISSGLARFAFPGSSAYASMKGAVEVLTRYLAKELGHAGSSPIPLLRVPSRPISGVAWFVTILLSISRSPM